MSSSKLSPAILPGELGAPRDQASPEIAPTEYVGHVRAMATEVTIKVPDAAGKRLVIDQVDAVLAVFTAVESACTRFDEASPLMVANASPNRWHRVPSECFKAIQAAHGAYERTGGVFDPRVLRDLVGLGYDRTLPFANGGVCIDRASNQPRTPLGPWRPRFRGATNEVLIGELPIDLGGIGKGLAVGWASAQLSRLAPNHLVEAGGDCYCAGVSSEGTPWRIAVEDPSDPAEPIAVLCLRDRACTTSSIRVRNWKAAGKPAHHIIDAATGRPGGGGLLSVTVIGDDPALSEVWSKTLFLAGTARISKVAESRKLAAVWVTNTGELRSSRYADRYLIWQR